MQVAGWSLIVSMVCSCLCVAAMLKCSCYGDCVLVEGNLALSRALGDFEFKRNKDLTAEEQIVTGNSLHVATQTRSPRLVAMDFFKQC